MTARPIRVLELRSVVGAGGGPEKTILAGAAASDPARVVVTVCYLRSAADRACNIRDRAAALSLDYVEVVERGPVDYRVWTSLRRLVRERRIDVVHAHDYKTNLLALMLSRAEHVRPLTTAHGWTGQSWRERQAYYPLDKQLIRAFPSVIAVSHEIERELIAAGVAAERIHVVLNGIDPLVFRRSPSAAAAARENYGLRPGEVIVGSVGRLERQKRFDLLIHACALARQTHPTLRLFIAGEGSLRQALEAQARMSLPDACTFLGHQSDIRPLHHALDVFAQSSDYEGTPNAVLEAMALETPIVATAAGGTAELARHGQEALIVPAGDARALAGAIHHALVHPDETAGRVARARRRVETSLSFGARMAAVECIYECAVAGRAPQAIAEPGRCA